MSGKCCSRASSASSKVRRRLCAAKLPAICGSSAMCLALTHFEPILGLTLSDVLPLKIADVMQPASAQGPNVVQHVARTGTTTLAGRGAGV